MDKANHIQMIVDNRIIEVGISHDIIIGVYKLRNSHKEFTYQITDKAQIRILLIDFTIVIMTQSIGCHYVRFLYMLEHICAKLILMTRYLSI